MLKRIKEYYKQCKVQLIRFNRLSIKGSNYIKSFIFSILLTIIIFSPFMIIAYNVFSLYDPSTTTFKIMLFISMIVVLIFNGLASSLNVVLLKNYYPDNEDLKIIDSKDIFFVELLNPYMIIITVAIMVFIFVTT